MAVPLQLIMVCTSLQGVFVGTSSKIPDVTYAAAVHALRLNPRMRAAIPLSPSAVSDRTRKAVWGDARVLGSLVKHAWSHVCREASGGWIPLLTNRHADIISQNQIDQSD